MDLNWSEADAAKREPGFYLAIVTEAKAGRSKVKGEAYINLRLATETFDGKRDHLCYDNVKVQGGGASIGFAKLQALGVKKGTTRVEPEKLVGRRAWARVDFDTYNGKTNLKVITTFQPFECGLWPEDAPPPGVQPSALAPVDDTPF